MEFENVEHHIKDRDYADVTFEYNGVKALVEVEGATKQGDKVKALQLDGWMKAEVAKDEREPDKLQGFFFVNHFREKDARAQSERIKLEEWSPGRDLDPRSFAYQANALARLSHRGKQS